MPRPSRESIDTFMAITGTPEPLAVRRLEEYGGNLNEAVNAHFTEGIHQTFPPTTSTYPHEMDSRNHDGRQGLVPLFHTVRSFKPSSLLDPNYRRNFFNQIGASAFASPRQFATSPSNMTGSAEAFDSGNQPPYHSGSINTGVVIGTPVYSSTPAEIRSSHTYGNDAEDEMLRAAIEASKQEFLSGSGLSQRQPSQEDKELDRAISLSLMEAEQEKEKRVQQVKDIHHESGFNASHESADKTKDKRSKLGSASQPDEIKLEGLNLQDDKSNQHYHDHIQCGPDAYQSDQKMLIQSGGSLPQEPAPDDRESINLAVRMPDGARHGRRFLMTDKLQSLFDFIDAGGWAKPMAYRLIRPYPREEFTDGDRFSSFSALGLTGKQEALFLEFI
ncbi:plant UBX domain-containing protein 9 isoform X1 [Rhodamnia argentea]|uniref:Plant UBX domain-containing protein 9 isoform X1 n=1 Tax=Rhodamnia argentea TaxID=178133 RepID=A0A8B8NR47_9MYRT|nr:plant UBX domain-containing protein 9 isoform X1 [Rhodamnia argentea]